MDIRRLCRVCSGAGLYDIHARIPFFLHASPAELNFWPKTIATMLEEITGNNVAVDDKMPQKICTVCISYLKHAVTFRQQAINNILSLQSAKSLNSKEIDVASDTPECYPQKFFSNKDETQILSIETFNSLKEELDLFFDDDNIDESDNDSDVDEQQSDEEQTPPYKLNQLAKNENVKTAIHNFFNYSEKPFEEDDILNFDSLSIKISEGYHERKCNACSRRFMLNESYECHLKECIQKKLMGFIQDSNKLMIIKQHKAISSQEFVRRMIFSVKNIVRTLALCYRVLAVGAPIVAPIPFSVQLPPINTKNSLQINQKNVAKKIFPAIEQNVFSTPECKIDNYIKSTKSGDANDNSLAADLLNKKKQNPIIPKIPNFVAKCPSCLQTFDSLQALEMHNQRLHNRDSANSLENTSHHSDESETRRNLLALLTENDYQNEGIVDVLKLRQKNTKSMKIDFSLN